MKRLNATWLQLEKQTGRDIKGKLASIFSSQNLSMRTAAAA